MTTIKEVADLAKVSVATVSRVINNNGYVHKKTRCRVNQAIEELNYKPNDVARSLFKGRSKMIALLVPDIMNPFFPELARAVEDYANQQKYTFVLCNTDDSREKEKTYLEVLQQKSVDGVIIVSSSMNTNYLDDVNVPIVALDRLFSEQFPSVTVNSFQGAKEAVKYLKTIGCHRIGHIRGSENASNTMERLEGYLAEVEGEDWYSSSYIESGEYEIESAKNATKRLLSNHPEIDGIFAANDMMAVGSIKAIQQFGYKVPEDVSVIGFDGIALGETSTPTLTTMKQPVYKIGTRAAEILIEQIKNPGQSIQEEKFEVTLIERESTRVRSEPT